MFLFFTTLSLVIGLYLCRFNLVLSILIVSLYLLFVLWRFGKKKLIVFIAFLGLGVFIPRITLDIPNGPDYGGIVIDARDNYYIFQSKFEKYYVVSKENNFEIGDKLVIKGETSDLKITTFESRFNFEEYLNNKGVNKELKVTSLEVKRNSLVKIRKFQKKFLSKFDQDTATLVNAFLFNQKDYSASSIKQADNLGILYLFSLSGIYLSVLFKITDYLYKLKFSEKNSKILTIATYLPFAIFSFTKIGTLRVFGLYSLKYLNEFSFKRRKFSHIELVSILALIFLIIDYNLVYQEAFYIGFLLSLLAPIVLNAVKCFKKGKRKIAGLLIFTLLTFPLRVKSSYLDLLYPLYSYLLIPYNIIFLILMMLSVILPLNHVLSFFTKGEIWILKIADLINIRIPFSDWGGTFSFIFIIVFLLLIFYLESVRKRHASYAGLILISFITISIVPLQTPIGNAVYFVNVGQGDSIIIKNKNHTVMIDTGGNKSFDMAEETLIPFMNKKKITHIDALILTHDDFDHSGAKDSLIENFKVKEVLTKPEEFPYKIGNLKIDNLNTFSSSTSNDSSLVLYTEFINKKFLFMGDASTNVEEQIINRYSVDCDILKVGHHGSKTSTSAKFIKAVTPEEAVISVGAKNFYGHPNTEVIEILNKYNVKIRRTDEEGTICYFSLRA